MKIDKKMEGNQIDEMTFQSIKSTVGDELSKNQHSILDFSSAFDSYMA